MNVTILYTANTPADRDIEYIKRKLTDERIEPRLLDADSREGIALTELYEVMQRPAILVTDRDGRLAQKWQGMLPPVQEIRNAYHSI